MLAFRVQLDVKKVRVVLLRRKVDGPFYARWSWKNKPYFICTEQTSEPQARAQAKRLVEQAAHNKPLNNSVDLPELAKKFIFARWPADQSSSGQKSYIRKFASTVQKDFVALSRKEASRVVQDYISTFKPRRKNAARPGTLRAIQRAISAFCGWLEKHSFSNWESNPASIKYLDLPVTDHVTKGGLEEQHIAALLAHAQGPLRALIVLGLGLGGRPCEASRAKWEDIDFESKIATLIGKKRQRRVHLSDWTVEQLLPLKATGPIYPKHRNYAHAEMSALVARLGLPKTITLQALRRTAARQAAGHVSVFEYSDLMGHSLDVAKRHYIGWGLTVDRAAVNAAFNYKNPVQKPVQDSHKS